MAVEIERKFLVIGDSWKAQAVKIVRIQQAYLSKEGKASVRVRIRDNATATITVKSKTAQLVRAEFEYRVPVADAEAMLALRQGNIIDKARHIVPFQGYTWEIDVFQGSLAGLVLAEVELPNTHASPMLPGWVGREVTGDPRYSNMTLALPQRGPSAAGVGGYSQSA